MKRFFDSKLAVALVIAVLLVAVLVLLLVVFQRTDLIKHLIIALIILGVIWIAIEVFLRVRKKRKSRQFDERVAAKEGIEDRKKEWASWSAELERQGIDRYELPFYLLLGEPQSGKSILLQNSDLHFPFGQQRLSGVGGTRGCDWWFTDQAVVLDLAGRLFTHQGGASDAFEWESFLELLGDFRPLCPANGIVLVLPCDNLLEDQAEATLHKAGRMQAALVTLINKLQAQLPVYVVLTKADKVFGFAECVHRLDTPQRQQMFGWSRPTERMEAPFQLSEAQEGFQTIVARSRLLRAEMMGTARLPDDSAAVQRAFAFPDELASLWPNLELYLRTIFTDNTLVARLFFRGLYLSSGLQTGVPIAKVCASLLSGSREADSRALEHVFTKQRAYFIRDLVRERVFAERSLVRPTSARIGRAKRAAMIGYGVAAAIAVVAVAGAAVYSAAARPGMHATDEATHQKLKDFGDKPPSVEVSVELLNQLHVAIQEKDGVIEEVGGGRKKTLIDASAAAMRHSLLPQLRADAAGELRGRLSRASGYQEFLTLYEEALTLLGEFDAGEKLELLLRSPRPSNKVQEIRQQIATAKREYPDALKMPAAAPLSDADAYRDLARAALSAWEQALVAGCDWQVGGVLGLVIARDGIETAYAEMKKALGNDERQNDLELAKAAVSFGRSVERFDASRAAVDSDECYVSDARGALEKHSQLSAKLKSWEGRSTSDGVTPGKRAGETIDQQFGGKSMKPKAEFTPPQSATDERLLAACQLAELAFDPPVGNATAERTVVREFVAASNKLLEPGSATSRPDALRGPAIAAAFGAFLTSLREWEDLDQRGGAAGVESKLSDQGALLVDLVRLGGRMRELEGLEDLSESRGRLDVLIGQGSRAWGAGLRSVLVGGNSSALFEALSAALAMQNDVMGVENAADRTRLVAAFTDADQVLAEALTSPRFNPISNWQRQSVQDLATNLMSYLRDRASKDDQSLRKRLQALAQKPRESLLFPATISALPEPASDGASDPNEVLGALSELQGCKPGDLPRLAEVFGAADQRVRAAKPGFNVLRAWEVMAKRVAVALRPTLVSAFDELRASHDAQLEYLFATPAEMDTLGAFEDAAKSIPRLLGVDGDVRRLATRWGISDADATILGVDLEERASSPESAKFEALRFVMRIAYELERLKAPLEFVFELTAHSDTKQKWTSKVGDAQAYCRLYLGTGGSVNLSREDGANPYSLDWKFAEASDLRFEWSVNMDTKHSIDVRGTLAPCFLWWWANPGGNPDKAELPVPGGRTVRVSVVMKQKDKPDAFKLPVRPPRPPR